MEYESLDSDVATRPKVRSLEQEQKPVASVVPESEFADVGPAIAGPVTAMSPAAMIGLQRTAGNAAVTELVQRKMAELEGEEEESASSPVLDVVGKGGGEPLADDLRGEMESRLGDDFGDVRVHTGSDAAKSATSVSARAYTVGNEIVLGSEAPTLDSDQGKHTLAHELTHVIQQREGPVAGTPTGDGISLSHPADEFEQAAERNATTVMSDVTTGTQQAAGGPTGSSGPLAQRALTEDEAEGAEEEAEVEPEPVESDLVEPEIPEEVQEEAPVQGLWLQRDPLETDTDEAEEEERPESEVAENLDEMETETEADEAAAETEDEEAEMETEQEESEAEAQDEEAEAEEEAQ